MPEYTVKDEWGFPFKVDLPNEVYASETEYIEALEDDFKEVTEIYLEDDVIHICRPNS